MSELSLRHSSEVDRPFAESVDRERAEELFAGTPLPAEFKETLIAQQVAARQASFAGCEEWIAVAGDQPVGRAILSARGRELWVVDLAVARAARGAGVGGEVLAQVKARAQAEGRSCRLSVSFENPARRLYARSGFVEIGSDSTDLQLEWRP